MDTTSEETTIREEVDATSSTNKASTQENRNLVSRDVIGQQVSEWKTKAERNEIEYKKLLKKYSELEQKHTSTIESYEWTAAIGSSGLTTEDEETREVLLATLKTKYKKALTELSEGEERPTPVTWLKTHLEAKPSYLKSFIKEAQDKNSGQVKVPASGQHRPDADSFERRKKEIQAMPPGPAKTQAMDKYLKDRKAANL